ncbi:hypothetical protein BI096_gp41 [Enterobacter phage Arya]|uniref:Uncharacterized protein n=1 Tax=Enterobacter phage Arya TaxID=1864622 RepID=A0A193GYR2_9CAUD|nr:hypothetical protein BI096_gp41 [Enterobacter phage Arya]ANN86164.1 hypothetical protein BI096_gp41 [Enterobacter phage Arya]
MLVKETNGKINFIDRNDCFVGFDYAQDCCESFGWYLNTIWSTEASPLFTSENFADEKALDGFWFDTATDPVSVDDDANDEGGTVAFRCVNSAGDVLWLHLYNAHNGYYSHGWETSWGQAGSL